MDLKRDLRRLNLAVATVHGLSFLALVIISSANFDASRSVSLWTDFGGSSTVSRGSYKLLFTLLPFPFITALFHIAAAGGKNNYYKEALSDGVVSSRWIEYSITNGLMSWSLVLLAGGGNIVLPILAVLFNVLMQVFGYLHELANHPRSVKEQQKTWFYMVFGFVPWAANWFVVLFYFLQRSGSARFADWLAIIGSLLLSLLFVVPLFWRYTKPPTALNNYRTERAYLFLSLSAKLWLDWVVTVDTL